MQMLAAPTASCSDTNSRWALARKAGTRALAAIARHWRARRLGVLAVAGATILAAPAHGQDAALTPMPPDLEVRLALSAAPPALRDSATVHVLDPAKGYRLARNGSSGVVCIVERTQWELSEYRDDLYVPLCYDAAGAKTYLRAIMDTARMRAEGVPADVAKQRIEDGFRSGRYVPDKAGLSYMLAPVMRTLGPPDLKMHTMAMPHLMFYAPGVTNADIGALPDLAKPETLQWPFVDRQGHDAHSYLIQMAGAAEKQKILADAQPLLAALCAHRDVLCLDHSSAGAGH